MRRIKLRYYYSVKWLKKNREKEVEENLASKLREGDTSSFWAAIKKLKDSKSTVLCLIDGVTGSVNIANLL